MFSTDQQTYIDAYLPTMRAQGYKYYIAYTDSTSSAFGMQHPDLYLIFSKDKITCSGGYTFSVVDGSTQFSIYSGNSSSGAQRVTQSSKSGTVRVDTFEHIYTNAEYLTATVIQPDYYLNSRGDINVKVEACCFSLIISLIISLLAGFIFKR